MALNPDHIRVSPDPVLPQCVRPAYQTPTVCQIQLGQNLIHPLLPPALLPFPHCLCQLIYNSVSHTRQTLGILSTLFPPPHFQISYCHLVLTILPPKYFLNLFCSSVPSASAPFQSLYHLSPRTMQ